MIKQYSGFEAKVSSGAREVLPAGGYVAKVVSAKVESYDWGDKLVIAFDIEEDDYRGFFKKDFEGNTNEDKKWRGTYRATIPTGDGSEKDGWSVRTMNNVIGSFEASNDKFHWDWDERKLNGKLVGVLFRNKEWEMHGRTGWTTECCALTSADNIRAGKFKMPKDKPLDSGSGSTPPASSQFVEADDSGDLPF